MRAAWSLFLGLVAVLVMVAGLLAEERGEKGREVTLRGTITCAKCDLKETDKCATVIDVKEGGQKGVYYFDSKSHKEYHQDICKTPREGTVRGTISDQGGKKTIHVSKVDYQGKR